MRVEDNVHEVELSDADQLEGTIWYKSSRPLRKKTLQELATLSLYRGPRTRGPHQRRVDIGDQASARTARALSLTPLLVLTENDISDGTLVAAAIEALASPATIELCFGSPSKLDPPAFEIDSRGGHGELRKLLRRRRKEASDYP